MKTEDENGLQWIPAIEYECVSLSVCVRTKEKWIVCAEHNNSEFRIVLAHKCVLVGLSIQCRRSLTTTALSLSYTQKYWQKPAHSKWKVGDSRHRGAYTAFIQNSNELGECVLVLRLSWHACVCVFVCK